MSTISCSSILRNFLFLLAVLLLQFLLQSTAQISMNMTRGGVELVPSGGNSSIASPSGDFAFGFQPINQSHFLLAIWFNATSPQTIIWFLNDDHVPYIVSAKASFMLEFEGKLSLTDDSHEVWTPPDATDAFNATLTDDGNFVLYDGPNNPRWQSFDSPTDTIVPGQNLPIGNELQSKLTDNDFSKGRFTLAVQTDENVVLYSLSLPSYDRYKAIWASNTVNTNGNCRVQLVFYSNGTLQIEVCGLIPTNVTNAPKYISSNEYYQRATLDPDGIFRVYTYPKKLGVNEWTIVGKQLPDGCRMSDIAGGGACGFNAYCNSSDANQTRLHCECPPGYSFVDQERKYKGCMPDFDTPNCNDYQAEDFEFRVLNNTDWPDPEDDLHFNSIHDKKNCIDLCLSDCFCMVAVVGADACWKRSLPLQFGQHGTYYNDRMAYMKVAKTNTTNSIIGEKNNRKLFPSRAGFILLGGLLVVVALLSVALSFLVWKKTQMKSNLLAIRPRPFTYKEIQHATRGFCEVLGRGGFGIVYRGLLESEPQVEIAVKKLEIANEGEREFKSEVYSIGQTNHKNLVKMIGFCNEGKHRLLVYEYMSNGSLDRFIFSDIKLGWNQRARIPIGIAKGLHYLHAECSSQVIHCDIKPQNILLDDNLVPKIADFGVAKLLFGINQTRTSTIARGTPGYFAPEWLKEPEITSKVDVYSFGIVLLEIICCKRNVERWASECLRTNSCKHLVEGDDEAEADIGRVELFVRVALSCIQDDPTLRPTMHEVAHTLADS